MVKSSPAGCRHEESGRSETPLNRLLWDAGFVIARLQRLYGKGRWRKLRGIATVRLADDTIHTAEVHWYEAHWIGRKEFKLKFPLLN